MPEEHRKALGLIALFRMPVGVRTLAPLWEKVIRASGPLERTLDFLHREHLLTEDPGADGERRYTCHPILRDHFRGRMMGTDGFTRDAANLLGEAPDAAKALSLEVIMPTITAIELLLECGDLKAADDLYRSRLENGNIFIRLPAPLWGMEVSRWFVRDDERRKLLEAQLGEGRLSFYLNDFGLYGSLAGEPEAALPFYSAGVVIDRRTDDTVGLSDQLRNLSEVEISLGRLGDAVGHAIEALELVIQGDDNFRKIYSHANVAFAESLRGDVVDAAKAFAEANVIENRTHEKSADLYSLGGTWWAEHLIRTGQNGRATELTTRNRTICERNSWHDDIARCEWTLGWLDVLGGKWLSAKGHLDLAEYTFTRGHMIQWLARVRLVSAVCHLGEGHFEPALIACDRALNLAAPRNYRLIHADCLVLRARVALARNDAPAARNDAEAALQLAEFCEYAWAERDACEVLAVAWRTLGNRAEATRFADRYANLNRRLTLTTEPQEEGPTV